MYLTFGLKAGPNLEDWSLKLGGGVFSWVGMAEMWWESDATLAPVYFFIPWDLDPDPRVNSLGASFFYGAIGSLDFGVSFVLDPSLNLPLLLY